MAITAISNLAPFDYVPELDRDSESPTTFKLKPLNGMQYMEVISELKSDGGETRLSGKGMHLAINHGLVGWDNFSDDNGKAVKFNPANINKIPPIVLAELAGEIVSKSELGVTETKNS